VTIPERTEPGCGQEQPHEICGRLTEPAFALVVDEADDENRHDDGQQEEPAPWAANDRPARLDELDSRLLAALSKDGRRSYADLAGDLQLSETTVARRIAALTAAKRLYFLALVDPAAVGYELEALIHFRVEPSALESTAKTLAATHAVRYMAATTGSSDLTCDAVFRDNEELYEFLTQTVGGVRGILHAEVDVVLEAVKRQFHYPLFGSHGSP